MDIKLRRYSHSIITKIIVFLIVITCFTGSIYSFVNVFDSHYDGFNIVLEDSYYLSSEYMDESRNIIGIITDLMIEYRDEENIMSGRTVRESEIKREEEILFWDFKHNSKSYNPNLNYEENYNIFKEEYADKISKARENLIYEDLNKYNELITRLSEYKEKGIIYYVSDGEKFFTNTNNTEKEHFKSYPSYMIFDRNKEELSPGEIIENNYYYWFSRKVHELRNNNNVFYISFTEEFLNPQIEEWKKDKAIVTNWLYRLGAFLLGLMLSFIYLLIIIGRKSFKDKEVHMNSFDRLYNDIKIGLCIFLISLWIALFKNIYFQGIYETLILITAAISILGLILVLSLVKHIKNRTILKHSLVYIVFYKIFRFLKDVYESGSIGVKIVVIVIGYPILISLTFFIFPITIGFAAWLDFKRVKEFNAIKEGVEKIKNGNIYHKIDIAGNGEFGKLAANINSITEGLNKAVESELKSERLKTELITNVSHDIRTPLTSIITYIDLLKMEKDSSKAKEYIEIIDQKSNRLKTLTDDLFEATKASSGIIPVNHEKIDILSLITQGLGELNDKIKECELEFKINHPQNKIYISADGKLLWRAIENLLSNILKYSLKGSRVYIDIEDLEHVAVLTIKNISRYELNISADELIERFKRGDESRSSQGSGLGLSIAKSLIDIQKGEFDIKIDGDLFKVIIHIPKYK